MSAILLHDFEKANMVYSVSFRLTMQGCLRIIELPHQKGVFLITYVFNLVFDILYVLCLVLYHVSPLFIWNARFELNFAVNVVGTYAMTELMLPLLEKAAPDARVITVSSGGMYTVPLTKDLQVTAYIKFKLATKFCLSDT